YTAPWGGVVLCRDTTERNALTASATAANPIRADVAGVLWTCNDATMWRPVPFAQAAGSATVTSSAAPLSNTVAVTFPTGRFAIAPEVFAQHVATAASTDGYVPMVSDITAAGFNLRLYRATGGVWSTGQPVQWSAVQMLSTAAAG
ncbi:MAG TPA: hypothetical protein VFE45_17790, partial [Coriobacteriia bacterium]|nr:hypothetical protein [Coriobacteriia bacterium]